MPDKQTRSADRTDASGDPRRPPRRLIHEVRESVRAAAVYASALSDRIELACALDPAQLDNIPPDLLLHLEAVSEAFQDGASHALWYVEPAIARSARTLAALARAGAGDPPQED